MAVEDEGAQHPHDGYLLVRMAPEALDRYRGQMFTLVGAQRHEDGSLDLIVCDPEPTDEMVERVAVGMVGNDGPPYWRCLSEPQKEWHRGRARRALDAAFKNQHEEGGRDS